jgi:hypothetical protein
VSGTSGTSAPGITSGTSGSGGSSGTTGTSGTSAPGITSGTSGSGGSSGTTGTSGTTPPGFTSGTSGTNGGLITSGTTENGVFTWQNTPAVGIVESNLTFDGSTLTVTGNVIVTTSVTGTTFRETYSDLGTGGSVTLDLATANNFRRQFNGSATITFSNPPASNAFGFTFTVVNAGGYSITWPGSVDWPGGTAPVLTSSGTDVLTFFTFNGGTTYYGFVVGKNLN